MAPVVFFEVFLEKGQLFIGGEGVGGGRLAGRGRVGGGDRGCRLKGRRLQGGDGDVCWWFEFLLRSRLVAHCDGKVAPNGSAVIPRFLREAHGLDWIAMGGRRKWSDDARAGSNQGRR